MKRILLIGILGLVIYAGVFAVPAQAQFRYVQPQFGQPANRPTFSPYLNLGRGGNPAITYYGIIRPQLQTTQAIQMLDLQQGYLEQALIAPGGIAPAPLGAAALGGFPTAGGTPGYFFNYSHYYPQMRTVPLGGTGRTR